MALTYFVTVLVLPAFAAGATLHSDGPERPGRLMRRERKAVQLNSGGGMTVEKKSSPAVGLAKTIAKTSQELCSFNFTAGTASTSNCTNPNTQKLMQDPGMCLSVAKASCPGQNGLCYGSPFVINVSSFFDVWPKGCFTDDSDPPVWFFNPAGYWPENIAGGTPMCVEPEYINGTEATSDCGQDEYELMTVEYDCRSAKICLGEEAYDMFRTLDATEQQARPKGCHFGPDHTVKFNPVATAPTGTVQGKPLCHLKPQ